MGYFSCAARAPCGATFRTFARCVRALRAAASLSTTTLQSVRAKTEDNVVVTMAFCASVKGWWARQVAGYFICAKMKATQVLLHLLLSGLFYAVPSLDASPTTKATKSDLSSDLIPIPDHLLDSYKQPSSSGTMTVRFSICMPHFRCHFAAINIVWSRSRLVRRLKINTRRWSHQKDIKSFGDERP